MSTRATYRFIRKDFSVTIYIHYDGYAAGAADYLRAALNELAKPVDDLGRTRRGLAVSFVAANNLAEFTRDHAYHDDTEFEYDITRLPVDRLHGPRPDSASEYNIVARNGYGSDKQVFSMERYWIF